MAIVWCAICLDSYRECSKAVNDSVGGGEFLDEQRGDQETGQREEEIDPEESARQSIVVKGQHADHGQGPQAVESAHALTRCVIGLLETHVVIVWR